MNSRKSSGQRPRKKKFQGNKYLKKVTGLETSQTVFLKTKQNQSSKGKKMPSSRSVLESCQAKSDLEFQGYRLVDINVMFSNLQRLLCCIKCHGNVKIVENSTIGLSSRFQVSCANCAVAESFRSCEMIGERKNVPEINRRSVLAMRCLGQGLTGLETFCEIMCLPPPVSQKAYDSINSKLADITYSKAVESMKRAVAEDVSSSKTTCITVSGDGTWKTRGHSSLVGVCTLIGAESEKLIDVEVMSSFCKGCDSYRGAKFGPNYSVWLSKHKIVCKKNHSGSAGKMEVDGMLQIFHRSFKERGVKYQQYIGDGDSKTFTTVCESSPYGKDFTIEKVECVGHIQKRMGTRLRKLKASFGKKKLPDGKTIGGKGRLTDTNIKKLTMYYGNAIRANKSDVASMRTAIWAIWAHYSSTDEEPRHWFCPKGAKSWCKYNVAVHHNLTSTYHHEGCIPQVVMAVVKPIFKDLSNPKLLKRCLGGQTQNRNESFNSLIWKYCPKVSGAGVKVVKIATYIAVCVFNDGYVSLLSILQSFGLKYPRMCANRMVQHDRSSIAIAEKRTTAASFEARRAKKLKKALETEQMLAREGEMYCSGAF